MVDRTLILSEQDVASLRLALRSQFVRIKNECIRCDDVFATAKNEYREELLARIEDLLDRLA